jgi:hypothetical protein
VVASTALALAPLARETGVLIAPGVALAYWAERQFRRAALAAAAVLPALGWWAWLAARTAPTSMDGQLSIRLLPQLARGRHALSSIRLRLGGVAHSGTEGPPSAGAADGRRGDVLQRRRAALRAVRLHALRQRPDRLGGAAAAVWRAVTRAPF